MMKTIFTVVLCFVLLHGSTITAWSESLEEGLSKLTGQISNGMDQEKRSRIAVIEFSDLHGNVTEFGKYISEELTTRLFLTKKFNVVERQLINKVLKEHKLSYSGLIDPKTVKSLGKILGVDVICSGTLTDMESMVKL